MKKTLSVLLALAMVLCALPLFAFGEDAAEDFGGVTLNVYNWGEYAGFRKEIQLQGELQDL